MKKNKKNKKKDRIIFANSIDKIWSNWALIVTPTQEHGIILLFNIFKILNNIKFVWFYRKGKFDNDTNLGQMDFLNTLTQLR